MEAAMSTAVTVGIEALNYLNKLLADKDTATGWYGDHSPKFIGHKYRLSRLRLHLPLSPIEITHIFRVKKDDWQQTIEHCLSNYQEWTRYAQNPRGGECCWLPIYSSLPEEKRDAWCEKPKRSSRSIAAVKSLPAARLDSWGLIVLAFANGARPEVIHSLNGGYFAELSGKTFVVTLWQ
ncbi:hypothetical protein CI102_15072 [Trichoderma harzianum]|nr:hypothetical protein CI102_15072 [Trichoderma harzianum]